MIRGVDVSDFQETVDWHAVKAGGWTFGVAKATQGTGNVQDTFAANRSGMAEAGLSPRGLYHFAQDGDPVAQADHFCDVVGAIQPGEFIVLDIESNPRYFTLSPADWPGFIVAWCERAESRIGGPLVVYISESPASGMTAECARWPLWVAGYVDEAPSAWEDWRVGPWDSPVIWQYSSTGSVPGINGNCDVNIAPDDLAERLGAGGGAVAMTGWPEIDRFLVSQGVAINVPPEDWQTTAGTHAATSWHYQGMARDYSAGMGCDEAAVVAALIPFAVPGGPIVELFHAATGTWWPSNVGGHLDHCHAAIRPGASLPIEEDDDMADAETKALLRNLIDEAKWGNEKLQLLVEAQQANKDTSVLEQILEAVQK